MKIHRYFPKFRLSVNSVKTETAAVISKDATATKFNVQYLINYDLYNLYKNCSVFQISCGIFKYHTNLLMRLNNEILI